LLLSYSCTAPLMQTVHLGRPGRTPLGTFLCPTGPVISPLLDMTVGSCIGRSKSLQSFPLCFVKLRRRWRSEAVCVRPRARVYFRLFVLEALYLLPGALHSPFCITLELPVFLVSTRFFTWTRIFKPKVLCGLGKGPHETRKKTTGDFG
jgi:hypothetical protein